MNFTAMGVWVCILLFTFIVGDACIYADWTYPELHKTQRNRIFLCLAVFIVLSTTLIGQIK